jgi:dTDP-4-amino-4,6-dideoxygalactose transaminase
MIRFQGPELPSSRDIQRYFSRSCDAGQFSNDGPCARLLRERLEAYVGLGAHCVPVASATAGLLISLRALVPERTRGREVLVPSFTFVAPVAAIRWCGLEPVFVDVDPEGWHVDAGALADAIAARGDRVAAVLCCSAFGTPPPSAQRSAWELECERAELPLLVDSAAGFGAVTEDGARLGLQGNAEVFSFDAVKPFAVGEGGVVVTRSVELAQRIAQLSNFGFDEDRRVVAPGGLNAKLSELHAATALATLDRYPEILEHRRERAARISERLVEHGWTFQGACERGTWQFVPALADDRRERDLVLDRAAGRVELRTYYAPLHQMAQFADQGWAGDLAVTADLGERIVSLPMANELSDDEIDEIVDVAVAKPASRWAYL